MSTMWTRVEQSISELKELISLVPSLDLTDLVCIWLTTSSVR